MKTRRSPARVTLIGELTNGWCGYVPEQVVAAGYANCIGDFEAYSRSCDESGKPLRPEIYEKEHTKDRAFYHFGFAYDLPGTERAIHFPFNDIAGVVTNGIFARRGADVLLLGAPDGVRTYKKKI